MKRKNLFAFALLGILAFCMAGCNGKKTNVYIEETQNTENDVDSASENVVEQQRSEYSNHEKSESIAIEESQEIVGCENGHYYPKDKDVTSEEYSEFENGLTEVQCNSFDKMNSENTEEASQNSSRILSASVVGETSNTMFPYQDYYLEENSVKYMPKDLLRLARNEIYAQHGYIFKSEDLKEFFSYKDWYEEVVDDSEWQDSVLNEYEKKNLEILSKYEKEEYKALDAIKEGNYTKLSDGDFEIMLPSVWTDDNYYVSKVENGGDIHYIFYSKNNVLYGFGGHVFSLTKSKEIQQADFSDNFIELGKHGNYNYYMGQSTDVQHSVENAILAKEWVQLNNTYYEIADSFKAK